jgi:hypothetical protein
MASEDPQIHKPRSAGKRKYITLKIPQELEKLRSLKVVIAKVWL